jgi:formyltetrahydrofolate synthetase
MYLKLTILLLFLSGAVGYFYYSQSKIEQLTALNAQVLQKNEQYKIAVDELERTMRLQKQLSEQYNEESRKSKQLANEALAVINEHNLELLSYVKPKLIERRVNRSTEQLFREIENEINN